MTIAGIRRATSTLSPVPEMPQTPASLMAAAKERPGNCMKPAAREELEEDIKRRLCNDKKAIYDARTNVRKILTWNQWEQQHQEQKLKEAALDMIRYRKNRDIHVSNIYPVFADYVPPIANGKPKGADEEVTLLMHRQIDLLEHGRTSPRYRDDEELPPSLKKQEDEGQQELRNVPRYAPERKIRPPGYANPVYPPLSNQGYPRKMQKASRTTRSAMQASGPIESDNENQSESNSASDSNGDSDSDADSESAEDDSQDESEEDEDVPLVAVSRGLPLLKDMPMPAKGTPKPKHRFSTSTEGELKAVSRGWTASKDDDGVDVEWIWVEKKGLTPRKRLREDVEDGNPQSKKVKVEAEEA